MSHQTEITLRYQSRGYIISKQFSLLERIKLLLGYRLLFDTMMLTQHNPGRKQIATSIFLTPQKSLEQAVNAHEIAQKKEVKSA